MQVPKTCVLPLDDAPTAPSRAIVRLDALGVHRSLGERRTSSRERLHGGIDEQELLPHATPGAIRDRVAQLIETVGAGGGYIACPAHAIQPDTPIANILALYETALGTSIQST